MSVLVKLKRLLYQMLGYVVAWNIKSIFSTRYGFIWSRPISSFLLGNPESNLVFFWFLRLTTNPLNLLGFLWFFAYALRSLHRNLFSCEVRIQASVQQIAWYIQEVSTFSQFLHTDCQFFASLFADSDSDVMVFCVCVKWCIVGVRNLFLVEMNINIWYGCWSCRLYTTNSWLTVLNFCFSTAILLLHFSSHSWILISIRYLTISKCPFSDALWRAVKFL